MGYEELLGMAKTCEERLILNLIVGGFEFEPIDIFKSSSIMDLWDKLLLPL